MERILFLINGRGMKIFSMASRQLLIKCKVIRGYVFFFFFFDEKKIKSVFNCIMVFREDNKRSRNFHNKISLVGNLIMHKGQIFNSNLKLILF
jgi:hypothetical protein